jgi:hypothetical protein
MLKSNLNWRLATECPRSYLYILIGPILKPNGFSVTSPESLHAVICVIGLDLGGYISST